MEKVKNLLKEYSTHLIKICRVKQNFDLDETIENFMEDCSICESIETEDMRVFLLITAIEEQLEASHPIKHTNHFKTLKKNFGI